MDIQLLYFADCPHWKVADERLAAIAAGRPDITVTHHLVESAAAAEQWSFHGSPSILLDGVDPFADPDAGIGGPAGAPTVEQLRAAIGDA